jgi:hypothetical protein
MSGGRGGALSSGAWAGLLLSVFETEQETEGIRVWSWDEVVEKGS